jgi:hypothetical protein
MSLPTYDPTTDGPDRFAWILRAAQAVRAQRQREAEPFLERQLAQWRAKLAIAKRLDEREIGREHARERDK